MIERAKEEVELLIIFVVEEDKSFFPYEMRYEMVQRATEKLDQVFVLPSGKFIISSITFPEYFTKEINNTALISPVYDVMIFAESIAPALHITKRFVGTEPEDPVTAQYNQTLKEILPRYGIQLREFERYRKENDYVTATAVRNSIIQGNLNLLKDFLPISTIKILQENRMLGE